jgi:hypothetical protein
VRKSNTGIEAGRKVDNWVIGDQQFVKKVLSAAEANRLRISKFEQEGADLSRIALEIGERFGVCLEKMRQRQRGGLGSDARKAFAYYAFRTYNAPAIKIGKFLGVGGAAVSAMLPSGKILAEKRGILIK